MRQTAQRVALAALLVLISTGVAISATGTHTSAGPSNTITVVDAAGDVGRYTSLALDAAGNPVISYYRYTFVTQTYGPYGPFVLPTGDLMFVHCDDPFCAGPEDIVAADVTADAVVGVGSRDAGLRTSLKLDALGSPVIVYEEARHSVGCGPFLCVPSGVNTVNTLKLLRCNDPGCGGGDDSPATLSAGTWGLVREPSLVLDNANRPVIAAAAEYPLQVIRCDDPVCSTATAGMPEIWEANNDMALALDGSGFPVVSYWGPSGGPVVFLKLLHCNDPACLGGDDAVTQIDTIGENSVFPERFSTSLVLDSVGRPVISYFEEGSGDLRIAHCGDPLCSSGNTIVSVETEPAGRFNSIALDSLGNPVVSYRADAPSGQLRVLHCGNPNCTAGNTISVADAAGDVGLYTSLALDASGNPVVSYYDVANGDLKLLHCGDPTCEGSPAPPGEIIQEPMTPTATPVATPDAVGGLGFESEPPGGHGGQPVAVATAMTVVTALVLVTVAVRRR